MKFEAVTAMDLEGIRALQPEGWGDIVLDYTFYIGAAFCHPIKAVDHDKMVGVGTAIHFEGTGWLAHIIVDGQSRNQGIGTQIVAELLASGKRASIETFSLVATTLGEPIYTKAGFRLVAKYVFLERTAPWTLAGSVENIIPFNETLLESLYLLDRRITGEKRDPWLRSALEGAWVYCKRAEGQRYEVQGYYAPNWKEGPIVAETDEAGLELMKMKYATIDKIVVPADNLAAVGFLEKNGFTQTGGKRSRMSWGKELVWKPAGIFTRVGGNVG